MYWSVKRDTDCNADGQDGLFKALQKEVAGDEMRNVEHLGRTILIVHWWRYPTLLVLL